MPHQRSLYDVPKYYDIGFSFRDFSSEVDVFEECVGRYSKIPVRRVIELASGVSPHLEELAVRGYRYTGLDINPSMISYAKEKASDLNVEADFRVADMRRFSLGYSVDFAFTMCGSLYVQSTADMLAHLESVARALNPGGLYFLDWCINFEWCDPIRRDQNWTIEKDGIAVTVTFDLEIVDRASQLARHRLKAAVDDNGETHIFESIDIVRVILPQEFLLLLERSGCFEFIGWWNLWDLSQPVEKAQSIDRPITVVRRI